MLELLIFLLIIGQYIYIMAVELRRMRDEKDPCKAETCTYYTHYLRHGPPVLPHAAFHQAEKECTEWQERALTCFKNNESPPRFVTKMCEKLEKEVRA